MGNLGGLTWTIKSKLGSRQGEIVIGLINPQLYSHGNYIVITDTPNHDAAKDTVGRVLLRLHSGLRQSITTDLRKRKSAYLIYFEKFVNNT